MDGESEKLGFRLAAERGREGVLGRAGRCGEWRTSVQRKEVRGGGSVPVRDSLRGLTHRARGPGGRASATDDRTPTGPERFGGGAGAGHHDRISGLTAGWTVD
jgi:hypothetical protein